MKRVILLHPINILVPSMRLVAQRNFEDAQDVAIPRLEASRLLNEGPAGSVDDDDDPRDEGALRSQNAFDAFAEAVFVSGENDDSAIARMDRSLRRTIRRLHRHCADCGFAAKTQIATGNCSSLRSEPKKPRRTAR